VPNSVRRRTRRGFTLLEGAAAIVVVGITSAAALAAFGSELRAAGRLRHAAEAESLARERVAELELLPQEQLQLLPDSTARGAWAPPFEEYRWRAAAALVPGVENLVELRVDVAWSSGSYTLATRFYSLPSARPARPAR